ncbi:MAG: hypothetical protein N2508_13800 [Anaerolineae bacterium]|nr:hypothetical protein [Anaerolineae bacterium]
MERLLIFVWAVTALLAPQFIESVARGKGPLWQKRAISTTLVILHLSFMVYALTQLTVLTLTSILAGGAVVLWMVFSLYVAMRDWPREAGVKVPSRDMRAMVSSAIAHAETQLQLSPVECLERHRPLEGVYSHHFTRYSDGTWLEWLNPTDERGDPDFSMFAIYSNNQALVRVLAEVLSPPCNVERTEQPLWRDQ